MSAYFGEKATLGHHYPADPAGAFVCSAGSSPSLQMLSDYCVYNDSPLWAVVETHLLFTSPLTFPPL